MSLPAADPVADLLARASVERLPSLFARYEQQPEQMPAGAPGKVGLLALHFAARGRETRLVSSFASGPQRVQRALYLDPALPGMAFALVQSISGGILQGDRLAIDITASAGAQAHITTQSATKLYRMERNYATQRIRITVEPDAHVEFLPDYLIPYRGARLYQEIELHLAPDATLLFSDALAPGRIASGEAFAYDLLFTRLHAYDDQAAIRFADTLLLEPSRLDPRRSGLLGRFDNLGSLYVLTAKVNAAELATRLHDCLQGIEAIDGSASRLPRGAGVLVRVCGATMPRVQAALYCAWQVARQAILGVGVPPIHTIKYGREPAL